MTAVKSEQEEVTVIEDRKRFSQSRIWDLQRNFFIKQGTKAWSEGVVPHYVTSNTYMAAGYAKVVLAHLGDILGDTVSPPDLSEPIYIVELGTGSGRFSYHFLKYFFDILDYSPVRGTKITYVMSDFVSSTINDWMSHPQLQQWIKDGSLDFARFDAINDHSFELMISGVHLSAATVKNPLVVIANYFFDTLPVDIFSLRKGKLFEGLATLKAPAEHATKGDDELIHHITLKYDYAPIDEDYYTISEFNTLLHDYALSLPDTCLHFPLGSLYCIRTLNEISNNRLMILTADKGVHKQTDLLFTEEPFVALHGACFSLTLNYHALGRFITNEGGSFLTAGHDHSSINICTLLSGHPGNKFLQTRGAYKLLMEEGSPDDLFMLITGIAEQMQAYTLVQLIALLRLSNWDSALFMNIFNELMAKLVQVPDRHRQDLYTSLHKIWDGYFHIGEDKDLALCLGIVFSTLHYYEEALQFFARSCQLYGENTPSLYNTALCYYDQRQLKKGIECLEKVLDFQPDFELAKGKKMEWAAEMDLTRM